MGPPSRKGGPIKISYNTAKLGRILRLTLYYTTKHYSCLRCEVNNNKLLLLTIVKFCNISRLSKQVITTDYLLAELR